MPKLGLGLSLLQSRVAGSSFDPDALAYLDAVEAADGQPLEAGIRAAVNDFVVGCKTDGNWDSIVTSCIMAGARTVEGALIPLRGNAPTNNNFVAGDYSRTLGLLGNDSNKYLNTGYNNNDTINFPQNNSHISCYVTQSQTDGSGTFVGGVSSLGGRFSLHYTTSTNIVTRNRASTISTIFLAPIGFQANSRNNSANYSRRFTTTNGISDATVTAASVAPAAELLGVFAAGAGSQFSNARMSFYSIGKSLSIPSLDTRVTTLMNAIAVALVPASGLSLWLKGDTGVSLFSFDYKSRLVLSGSVSGTFNATSVPTYDFSNSRPTDYDLDSGASTISWNDFEGSSFSIATASITLQGVTTVAGYFSTDGNIWQTFGNWTTPPFISGLTNDYSSGNGQYAFTEANPYDNNKVLDAGGGIYYRILGSSGNWELWYDNTGISELFPIATNSNDLPNGTWTMLVEEVGTAFSTGSAYATNPTPPTTTSSITSTVATDAVTAWADQSGNANNATPVDSSPTYNSSDLNSKPTISLSSIAGGTNKSFVIAANPMGASGTTAFAVVYVEDVCGEGNDNGPIFGDFGIAALSSHYPYGGNCSVYDGFASADRKGPLTAPATIDNAWSLYSVVSTENDWRDYVNGALMHSDNTNVYSNAPYDTNLFIGSSSFGYTLKGKIAEAIMYNRVLTTPERQQVEAYLTVKYAITAV